MRYRGDIEMSSDKKTSFDETYPRYSFAEFVGLAIKLAATIVRLRRRPSARRAHTFPPRARPA